MFGKHITNAFVASDPCRTDHSSICLLKKSWRQLVMSQLLDGAIFGIT